MSNEKRKYSRVSLSFETSYFTKVTGSQSHERMYYPGKVVDMSDGGAGLTVNHQHHINEKIWLEDVGEMDKPVCCNIQWISENDGSYSIGVQYSN